MAIILFAVIVIIVVALLVYGVDLVPQIAPYAGLIKLLIIIAGVLTILQRAGIV